MKTKLKRSYYRKDFQVFISIVVVLAMIFSFIPLFITVLNALKSNYEINANIFAFPNIDAFWEDIKFNFSTAWRAIETSFISTILLSMVGGVVAPLLVPLLRPVLGWFTACIVFVAVFDMTAETALTYFKFVFTVYLLISSVPMLSMTVRRLRDAGYHRNNWWKLLIPGVFAIAPFLPHDPTGEDEE